MRSQTSAFALRAARRHLRPRTSSSPAPPKTTSSPVISKSLVTIQSTPQPRFEPETWFGQSSPFGNIPPRQDSQPNPGDNRQVKLGKTLRILHDHLPKLLLSPLPQEILAPNITLHLFPSTHPHLPVVSGRVAYIAALWTSPIAWNRVPIIGNVKIEILSERMTKEPLEHSPKRQGAFPEQLVVRWKTVGKSKNWGLSFVEGAQSRLSKAVGVSQTVGEDKEFTGIFIFEFDKEGRILSHTIETTQEGDAPEKGIGSRFVGITDWLLGGMKRQGDNTPSPAFARLGSKPETSILTKFKNEKRDDGR